MASLSELVMQQVKSAASNVEIPSNIQSTVLNGLSSSVLGSLTQTATKAGGIEQIQNLLTGKTSAASSPVTALAGNMFSNDVLKKLNLGSSLSGSLSGMVPSVMGKLSSVIKDNDGDGDIDLKDILMGLSGAASSTGAKASSGMGSTLKKAAAGAAAAAVLGKLFKKK